jgi:hypothetical protein
VFWFRGRPLLRGEAVLVCEVGDAGSGSEAAKRLLLCCENDPDKRKIDRNLIVV